MATDSDAPEWDDGKSVVTPDGTDDEEPTYRLDPGERLLARVRYIEWDAGRDGNGLLHLTTEEGQPIKHWMNATLRREAEEAGVSSEDWIGVVKDDSEQSFTDDDGEEVTYHERHLRVFE